MYNACTLVSFIIVTYGKQPSISKTAEVNKVSLTWDSVIGSYQNSCLNETHKDLGNFHELLSTRHDMMIQKGVLICRIKCA